LTFFTKVAEGFGGFTTTIVDSPAVDVIDSTIKLPNQVIGTVGDDITFGGDIRIKGNHEIEMGRGMNKEGNAGKIAYNKWGDNQLDIIGAGTDQYHRKINLWDDVEVAGELEVKGPLAIGSDVSGNPGSIVQYDDLMKRTDIKGYGEDGSRRVKLWDNAEVGFLDVKNGINVGDIMETPLEPNQNYGLRIKKGLDVSGELNANDRVYLKSELSAQGGAVIDKGLTVNDLLQANDGMVIKDVVDANSNGLIVKKRLVVNDIMDANDTGVSLNKPFQVQDVMSTTPNEVKMKKNLHVDGELVVNKKSLLNDTEVDGKLTTDSLQVNEDLNVDGDIVIGKGTNKWIISVGNRGQLEFLKDKNLLNRRDDTDKGHIVMEQDGNIWLSRRMGRGYLAENISEAKGTANNAKNIANNAANVNNAQEKRIRNTENINNSQDARLRNTENTNNAQDARLRNTENTNNSQEMRLRAK
jgi:cytoskeletal protein CcmA (bactofilin family)